MDEVRFQIFVSSTFADLREEREKVLQAILQLRSFPAGMELFPAADEAQFEFIKREIDSSDYYVVIVGGRYGSLSNNGLSFTEMEYDYARSKGKPILAFLVKDIGKLIGDKLESSESMQAKLKLFREKTMNSKLVKFYTNPDELKSEVLYSLPSQFNLTPMTGWVRAGQNPRKILQELADLQHSVIDLQKENQRLSNLQNQPELLLSHGTDIVKWELDLNQFSFDNKWPKERSVRLTTTWDELLSIVFSEGSSQVTYSQAARRITRFIVWSCPPEVSSPDWLAAADVALNTNFTLPKREPVVKVLGDVLRQFNGLGLLNEAKETIHVQIPHSQASKAETVDIWRLTSKGQQRLAMSKGYKRNIQ